MVDTSTMLDKASTKHVPCMNLQRRWLLLETTGSDSEVSWWLMRLSVEPSLSFSIPMAYVRCESKARTISNNTIVPGVEETLYSRGSRTIAQASHGMLDITPLN